jgi:hypothetical protein
MDAQDAASNRNPSAGARDEREANAGREILMQTRQTTNNGRRGALDALLDRDVDE